MYGVDNQLNHTFFWATVVLDDSRSSNSKDILSTLHAKSFSMDATEEQWWHTCVHVRVHTCTMVLYMNLYVHFSSVSDTINCSFIWRSFNDFSSLALQRESCSSTVFNYNNKYNTYACHNCNLLQWYIPLFRCLFFVSPAPYLADQCDIALLKLIKIARLQSIKQ